MLIKEISSPLYDMYILGDTEAMDKFNRRLVRVGKQHTQECKDLLKLMGIPYFEVIVALLSSIVFDCILSCVYTRRVDRKVTCLR